jgi:intracellular sulfur oxidation DsrE/DsrF family protein
MKKRLIVALAAFALTAAGFAQSKHRIVVELDTSGTATYATTLNNVENLKRAFGTDSVEIEIVCHAGGIDLLFSHDNKLALRIQKLHIDGVNFAACNNTLKGRKIGKDRIFAFAAIVDSGTAEVIRKQEAGWSYLHR